MASPDECTYIFLDESGNLDFSPKGTRYFVLTAVCTKRPFPAVHALDAYKHDCLEDFQHRLDKEYFHCAEDNRYVRQRVFGLIGTSLDDMRIDSIIVEKSKTWTSLRQDKRFYPRMLGILLKWILRKELKLGAKKVLVITDKLPIKQKRQAVEKACKLSLTHNLPRNVKHRIVHHESRSHYLLQVADYCCWAMFRKWERGDVASYNLIAPAIRSEFDVFRTGTTHYYY